jgi:hypothetical protein
MSDVSDQLATQISYYVRLLIFQYQLPKAQATIAILIKQLMMDGLPTAVQNAFNVNTAVGPQLDTLGKYIGIPRNIGETTPLPFFGFVDYAGGGNENGFTDYDGSVNTEGIFYQYSYSGQQRTNLSDDSYAFMMALKIVLNSSDGTLYSIQQFLNNLLPGLVQVVDNQDMTLTYSINVKAPVSPAVIEPYLPKPMGVGIIINTFATLGTDGGDTVTTDTGDHILIPGVSL